MAGLVEGAAVGAVFGEALKKALETIGKARNYESALENNIDILNNLRPVIKEIEEFNKQLDRPIQEVEGLSREMRAGEELISKCPKPRLSRFWKVLSFPQYHDKLKARDESLVRYATVNTQLQMARDVKEILLNVRNILEFLSKQNYGAPAKPEFTVGLDEPLKNLKIELLKAGVSVHVLTGFGGSGKSTLAKKLCWDVQIKGKFGKRILFLNLSKTPNLKIAVKELFQQCGRKEPATASDEDAVNKVRVLLREIGRSPILLVLDDVWPGAPGSESIVEQFKLQLPDYKILVTSRFEFPGLGTHCPLKPLCHEDSITLFRHFALPNGSSSYIPDEDFIQKVVRGCWGSPLALGVIGKSLRGQPVEVWQKMEKELSRGLSILDYSTALLTCLQKCLDVLEDSIMKECFMDLGLFPEDQMIPVVALIDMWEELHKLEDNIDALIKLYDLTNRNLATLLVTREAASDANNYYSYHFITQHDLLRELAINQINQEPFEQRKRLIFEINEKNLPDWGPEQKEQKVAARILSMSTDETFTSDWCNIIPVEAEVLVLNFRTNKYILPDFVEKMSKLKVLIVTNYDFQFSELHNFELLSSLSSLKRIRLEQVSVPSLGILKNLQKLSLYMCDTSQAFESSTVKISDALPNLRELNIDYCKDLVKLPAGFCDITSLKKLSITKCRRFSALHQEIGKLENLEVLRISSCADFKEIPDSIGRLHELSVLDISECPSLGKLPDEIGDLCNLEKLYMTGCSGCGLPSTVTKLESLNHVVCDEETAASWEHLKPSLRTTVPKVKPTLNWLYSRRGVRSRALFL